MSLIPSFLRLLKIFPSLPGSCLTSFYRDVNSALFNSSNNVNSTYSRSRPFRYGRNNTNSGLTGIELTTSALVGVQVTYYTTQMTSLLWSKALQGDILVLATRRGLLGGDGIEAVAAPVLLEEKVVGVLIQPHLYGFHFSVCRPQGLARAVVELLT